MKLKSPDFEDKAEIPEKFGYIRKNVNPELKFLEVPEDTESLVLIMDDPDAVGPAGKIWDHWILWDIPVGKTRIEKGESAGIKGENDFGELGYGGPNPPDRTHTYRFRLYALSKELELPEGSRKEEVLDAMKGSILEKASLEGDFDPI